MSNEYTLVVKFKALPGKEKALATFLSSIIDIALQSLGCIQHDLHRHLDDPSVFIFYEQWENKDAHENHIARSEVKEWRSKLNDFIKEPYEASLWKRNIE